MSTIASGTRERTCRARPAKALRPFRRLFLAWTPSVSSSSSLSSSSADGHARQLGAACAGKVCVSWGGRRARRQAATGIIVAVLVPHLLGLLLLRLLLRGHRAAERGEHASTRREPGSEGEGARGPVTARSDGGGKLGGASCMTRGGGRRPRPVARSQTREDHTTTPRWRARARIVLSRRGRPVSGFGQKKEKSTTCEPSTLRRRVGSRPTRG